MSLFDWANRHGISPQALQELTEVFGLNDTPTAKGMSEAAIQTQVRLNASKLGWRVFRNNVGVLKDERGVPVRYGLCNDTKQQNMSHKSSDLIGIRPLLITSEHVGQVIGQFVALEVKRADWKYTGSDREKAQLNFLSLIASLGGYSKFVTSGDNL